jgi:hypothetical protein
VKEVLAYRGHQPVSLLRLVVHPSFSSNHQYYLPRPCGAHFLPPHLISFYLTHLQHPPGRRHLDKLSLHLHHLHLLSSTSADQHPTLSHLTSDFRKLRSTFTYPGRHFAGRINHQHPHPSLIAPHLLITTSQPSQLCSNLDKFDLKPFSLEYYLGRNSVPSLDITNFHSITLRTGVDETLAQSLCRT